ncbi:MAG: hypothetical protein COA78_27405 [Blastopirellula sp.]|nr:MAG: hypothetical protein COA78_27405 [Blastopirellula sp.]
MLLDFISPNEDFVLTIEDNGKVAYAYLKKDEQIVGDVWLYNRCKAPPVSEWKDRGNLPFANCEGYIDESGQVTGPLSVEDLDVNWEEDDGLMYAYIYIKEDLFAVVGETMKPGFARFAIKDSRIARVMEMED